MKYQDSLDRATTISRLFRYGDKYKVVIANIDGWDKDGVERHRTYLANQSWKVADDFDRLLKIKGIIKDCSWVENAEYVSDVAHFLDHEYGFKVVKEVLGFLNDPLKYDDKIKSSVEDGVAEYEEEYQRTED
jgi:hypothetical protein